MNWLDFFASVIASVTALAWPAAVVACVWIFRREVALLLPKLQVKHKDLEVSFRLDKAEATAEKLPAEPNVAIEPPSPEEANRFEQLLAISPAAAMVDIRRDIEVAVRDAAERYDVSHARRSSLTSLVRGLREAEHIDREISALLADIISIGNIAAHERDIDLSPSEARRYRDLADQIIARLKPINIVNPQYA